MDTKRGATASGGWIAMIVAACLALIIQAPVTVSAQTQPDLDIVSRYYIVIDAETGEIFAQRDAHASVAPASLTKIFTAIEAIEAAPPGYQIVTTEADLVAWDATQVGFGPGEPFTLEDLLFGMMLPSGNDAARAVARALGAEDGDSAEQAVARFMERVNQRVRDMGLAETEFVNPDGWGVPGHRSSAHDIAAFTMYALKYPRFVEAISTETYQTSTGGYRLVNTNKRLGVEADLVGGKTGYDDTAGYCLMQVARRGGDTMIAVTLDGVAPDVWYDDNRALLDYAFAQKAARQGGPPPLDADVVRYLDPDAAAIARIARSNASIAPAPLALAAVAAADPLASATDSAIAPERHRGVPMAETPTVSANGLALAVLIAVLLAAISAARVRGPRRSGAVRA